MVGKIYLVVEGVYLLAFVREPAGTLILIEFGCTNYRHERKLSIVVDPWAGLMRLLEATNLVLGVGVHPAVAHLTGLRRPEVHAPGTCNGWVGVTC